jgi:dissimilatory sulfite reductase related protein
MVKTMRIDLLNNELTVSTDKDGFLLDWHDWSEDIAENIAESLGLLKLEADHWKVIWYLRNYVKENNSTPMIRHLCKDLGLNLKKIYVLFPGGPVRGAFRIAGLPKPLHCT